MELEFTKRVGKNYKSLSSLKIPTSFGLVQTDTIHPLSVLPKSNTVREGRALPVTLVIGLFSFSYLLRYFKQKQGYPFHHKPFL
jgi:hypothetical protein